MVGGHCKWEAYCSTNVFLRDLPFFKAWKPGRQSDINGGHTAVQIGGALQYYSVKSCGLGVPSLDEGQITHLICARLKYDLYDFFRGCFGPASCSFSCRKGPKTPPKKVI